MRKGMRRIKSEIFVQRYINYIERIVINAKLYRVQRYTGGIGKIREYYLRVLTDYRRSPGETNKAIISSLSIRNSMANSMCSTAFPIPISSRPISFFHFKSR